MQTIQNSDSLHEEEEQTVVVSSTISDEDRACKLRSEIDSMKQNLKNNQNYISIAREFIANPNESEKEKLEKKLVVLKGKISDKEHSLNQHRSSFESYKNKIDMLHKSKQEKLKHASDLIDNLSKHVEEDIIPASTNVLPSENINQLLEICKERETEIANMQKELETYITNDREVTSSLQSLQENIQEAIPRVEAEKDEVSQGILAEWENEKQALIGVYGRLCVINREQNYHLMRGTHIKHLNTKPDKQVGSKERRLNLDNTELAREVNALRDKVNLTEADVRSLLVQLTHIKKLNDSERKNFQNAKAAAEDRLQDANNSRQEMQIENNELRKLKNELLGVIQHIRENHLSIQRTALTDSKPPIEALHRIESSKAN